MKLYVDGKTRDKTMYLSSYFSRYDGANWMSCYLVFLGSLAVGSNFEEEIETKLEEKADQLLVKKNITDAGE